MSILRKWKVKPKAKKAFYSQFPEIPKVILDLLYNRKYRDKKAILDFFNPDYEKGVNDPFIFKDMKKAVNRIFKAKETKEKVAIFGDYDVDGVTSSTILFDVLKNLGLKPIVYIPDRKNEGYGLNQNALKNLKKEKVGLIITVDCGIRNVLEVKKASKMGMEIILTDHHLPGEELPEAFALINPKIKNEKYPFKELAGVGVAFKLASAIIKKAPKGVFKKGEEKWLLDLVALGTIADMVPLVDENRVLVKFGLIVLSKTRRQGIKSLFERARIPLEPKQAPNSGQISFQIAPRLNAAGRMDHANNSFELLKTNSPRKALKISEELEEKNAERQRVTEKLVREVEKRINLKDKFVFEGDGSWPAGILGLVAGKICEKYARPTFIFNRKDDKCRGSIRSIKGFKVVPALEEMKELLLDFGGHDFAGGFSFETQKQAKIIKRLREITEAKLKDEDLALEIEIDQRVRLSEIDWKFYRELKKMEPFGMNNSNPLFLSESLEIFQCNMIGKDNKHLKIWLKEDEKIFEALAFGRGEKHPEIVAKSGQKIDIIFEVSSDKWNGEEKIQLLIRDFKLR